MTPMGQPSPKLPPKIYETEFARLVREELARANQAFGSINSLHEGYGLLMEEVREFEAEVFKNAYKRDTKKTLAELVQVAAMCQKTAESMNFTQGDDE